MEKMVTMSDIAARAGVSRPTVSVILNQREGLVGIRPETRQRVLDAAAELGYRRNELARAVGTGQNRMIGFLATAPEIEFISHMLVGALGEADDSGYTLKILRMKNNILNQQVIDRCLELRLAGVLAIHVNNEASLNHLREELTPQAIPIAVVDSSFPQNWGIRIISNDERGASKATAHLIGLGHKRIAYVGGAPESGSSPLRENGYRRAMHKAGLPIIEDDVNCAYGEPKIAEQIARDLLSRPVNQRPSAIFCYSDYLALAVMLAAHRMCVRVPEELSVIGFGNLARTELAYPPLTSVGQPFNKMGALAVRCLLERVRIRGADENNIDAPAEHVLETELVIRESTAQFAV